jgi:TPR repeat protein
LFQESFGNLKHYRPFCFADQSNSRLDNASLRPLWSALLVGLLVTSTTPRAVVAQDAPTNVSSASADENAQKGYEAYQRKDFQTALSFFHRAADQGSARAQFSIGLMYREGAGVQKNDAQALAWFRMAADHGYAQAQNKMGFLYKDGEGGVRQDFAQALSWFRKAADQGDPTGQFLLGSMYMYGYGVQIDIPQALRWFQKAADNGNSAAENTLGQMYELGAGVPKNLAAARKWHQRAADHGNADSKEKLAQLDAANALTPTSRAAASSDAEEAFRFLQRQVNMDVSISGLSEPGLSWVRATDGDICRLHCGYHIAMGIHDVADTEYEFAMKDVALNTIQWEMDGRGRADFFFSSANGPSAFRGRSRTRKVEVISFTQTPRSDWSRWAEWDKNEKAVCRAKPDRADLDRVVKAFAVLAKACGARETPF